MRLHRLRRLPSETVTIYLGDGVSGRHRVEVCVAYDTDGHICELNFVNRERDTYGLGKMLTELGIKLSRLLQRRDPETGDELCPTYVGS